MQCKHAADPSPHPPDRKAPHADGCNCICRSELARELFKPQRAREQARSYRGGLCSANMRQIPALTLQTGKHPMQMAAIASVGASLSRELFNAAAKSSRDKLAPTGVVQCKHAADPSPHRPDRKAPHAGGCNCICRSELARELFNEAAKSSLLQGQAISLRSSKQSRACQSVSSGHGFSGTLTSTVLLPAARPQSRSKR